MDRQTTKLGTPQSVTIANGASNASANTFGADMISIRATTAAFFVLGAAPTATVDGNACHYIGTGERLEVPCSQLDKIAVISVDTTAGVLYVSPLV